MMRKSSRAVAVVIAVVALGAPLAGVAGASPMSVKAAIKAQEKSVRQTPALRKVENLQVHSAAQARHYVAPLRKVERKFEAAATAVSHASATSSRTREGRTDWVAGVRDEAHSLGDLATVLVDLEHHDKAAAKREAPMIKKEQLAAGRLILRADKLLGFVR